MAKYRAAVIGLGWIGMLYDLRPGQGGDRPRTYSIDDVDRPTPEVDAHRKFYYHNMHLIYGWTPTSYAEALWDRPEVDLVAGADRDSKRLKIYQKRYGIDALYTDAEEMLRNENLDIVVIATNTKGRADLACLAVDYGVKAVMTDKPMAHTLEEADRMVKTCADAGVHLLCGATPTNHPSFGTAKRLADSGAIGDIVSMDVSKVQSQVQTWSYFLNSTPSWVIGVGGLPRRDSGSDEFLGQGMMVTDDGLVVHFRHGAAGLRMTGTAGEILRHRSGMVELSVTASLDRDWRLWQDVETSNGISRVEMPWPEPVNGTYHRVIHGLSDLIDCLEGRLDEPKNSGRSVATALEVEIAFNLSVSLGSERVDLPLKDRSMRLNYDWFR